MSGGVWRICLRCASSAGLFTTCHGTVAGLLLIIIVHAYTLYCAPAYSVKPEPVNCAYIIAYPSVMYPLVWATSRMLGKMATTAVAIPRQDVPVAASSCRAGAWGYLVAATLTERAWRVWISTDYFHLNSNDLKPQSYKQHSLL